MKKLLIGLLTLTSISSFANEEIIKLIGAEADGVTQCELHLKGDFEQDSEGFKVNDAAIQNRLTGFVPLSFEAYIGNSGHNWYVSIGHENLKLNFNEDLDIESYIYTKNEKEIVCNLKDAEMILDF